LFSAEVFARNLGSGYKVSKKKKASQQPKHGFQHRKFDAWMNLGKIRCTPLARLVHIKIAGFSAAM
jgi:hypothetical protein